MNVEQEIRAYVLALLYAFTGMALLFLGYKLFDALTPTNLQRKIFDEGNVAVAVTVGLFMLGIAVVVHAALKA
jgi:putative membrane protein